MVETPFADKNPFPIFTFSLCSSHLLFVSQFYFYIISVFFILVFRNGFGSILSFFNIFLNIVKFSPSLRVTFFSIIQNNFLVSISPLNLFLCYSFLYYCDACVEIFSSFFVITFYFFVIVIFLFISFRLYVGFYLKIMSSLSLGFVDSSCVSICRAFFSCALFWFSMYLFWFVFCSSMRNKPFWYFLPTDRSKSWTRALSTVLYHNIYLFILKTFDQW